MKWVILGIVLSFPLSVLIVMLVHAQKEQYD